MKAYTLSRIPSTYVGKGVFDKIVDIMKELSAMRVLLLTGKSSFLNSPHYFKLINAIRESGIYLIEAHVDNEPSPELVDDITANCRACAVELVLAIGGGSVLDAGKAVSAMIPAEGSVMNYLEGIGTKMHSGNKVPFIAVPTTAGTGSEATKNAVLSRVGEQGFKKSLRHENFVPDYAVLDPELSLRCPSLVTASSGMDALNQLLEGYLSYKSTPYTEALALSGIEKVMGSLEKVCLLEPDNLELRENMALGAFLSGIALANAGLGYVHGFAGVIGGMLPIPHGVVCGKLNAPVLELVIGKILNSSDQYREAYNKLERLSALFSDSIALPDRIDKMLDRLYKLDQSLSLPSLKSFGLTEELIKKAVQKTSGKECPVILTAEELLDKILQTL
ncbi:MAG: iron-containing alcohol dehydrogenase [Clostridia bacterium]|nr:iron-containing alcohol dehydrogenase [Clostridia bacterium]